MAKVVGVKEAHRRLTKLIRAAEDGEQVVITRDGTPSAVLLGAREYESSTESRTTILWRSNTSVIAEKPIARRLNGILYGVALLPRTRFVRIAVVGP